MPVPANGAQRASTHRSLRLTVMSIVAALVVAVGNGKVKDDGGRIALDVKAGDLILFGKYSGQEIKLDGEEYLIMREDEVLAVLDDADKKKK